MPASLYRLANKPHHSETAATYDSAPVEALAIRAEEVAAAVVESELPAQETPGAQVDVADDNVVPAAPSWDPSWTKTKLLDLALSLGLNVSSTSTKTEIISALSAAT